MVVVDPATTTQFYVDDVLAGEALNRQFSSSAFYMDGGDHSDYYSKDKIDDVQVFDTALSAQEIAALNVGAVPEPATLALIGLGFARLGFSRKRKARRNGTQTAMYMPPCATYVQAAAVA